MPNTCDADALSDVSDADLVRDAQTTGNPAAVAALYQRYLPRVYRYFYARVGNVQQAEDLTSQTCIAALEALPRYQERGRFAAWLFTIAARRYADYCREAVPASVDVISTEAVSGLTDPAPLPDMVVVHTEQATVLTDALRALSPDRAQAIALHFFGGLTHKETAQAMGRSRVAVKSLVHRGLRDLRERLGNEEI